MAPKQKPADTADQPTSATSAIKIKDHIFSTPSPFAEGHVLSAVEAGVLNQTYRENLRNNFSGTVEKAIKAAQEAGTPVDGAALQAQFAAYVGEYKFGERKTGAGIVVDPVERRARTIARSQIEAKIRAKGGKVADYKDSMEGYINDLLARDPRISVEAKRQIDALKDTAADSLDEILSTKPAAPQAKAAE